MSDRTCRLRLQGLQKTFKRHDGTAFPVIDDLSLDVGRGEFLVLLGPSGCGKTTLLRCVAGLERPETGRIELNGKPVFDSRTRLEVPPERRQIGMVFQSYALWPHMTVAQNVEYPLQMRDMRGKQAREAVHRILHAMKIEDLAQQHPAQISGGQQQRVALARALVCGDDLILFDEPLSNVDAKVREHLRLELLAMQREFGFTAVYVTHDQNEAMALATHIAVISRGRMIQLGTPQDVYLQPRTAYVATFIGSANLLQGTLHQQDGPLVETPLGMIAVAPENVHATGTDVIVVSRPERWSLAAGGRALDGLALDGKILAAAFCGSHNEYLVNVGSAELQVWSGSQELLLQGDEVCCTIPRDALLVLDREEVA